MKGHSLGQLIKILRQTQMELVVDKLIDFSGGKDDELRDISGLGMVVYLCEERYNLTRLQLSRRSPLSFLLTVASLRAPAPS